MSENASLKIYEDSAFEYGCECILTIRFDLNEGYTLADTSNKLPGTINGETADNRSPINDKYVIFKINYTMPEAPTEEFKITVYSEAARNDSGYRISRAAPGTKVYLTANEPSEGKVFDRWSVTLGP